MTSSQDPRFNSICKDPCPKQGHNHRFPEIRMYIYLLGGQRSTPYRGEQEELFFFSFQLEGLSVKVGLSKDL